MRGAPIILMIVVIIAKSILICSQRVWRIVTALLTLTNTALWHGTNHKVEGSEALTALNESREQEENYRKKEKKKNAASKSEPEMINDTFKFIYFYLWPLSCVVRLVCVCVSVYEMNITILLNETRVRFYFYFHFNNIVI